MTTIPISERLHTRTGRRTTSAAAARLLCIGLTSIALTGVAVAIAIFARENYPTCALLVMVLMPLLTGPSRPRRGAK